MLPKVIDASYSMNVMIHLYIEHLLNIHTLSIQASLSTVSSKETKATLSADGTILTLTHEGESTSIKLPINLSPRKQSNVTLTIPAVPSRELSFRVQLEEEDQPNGNNILRNGPHEDGSIVPWTADSLTSETEVKCRQCSSTIISCGKVRTWKDLPSEGWAEMMEFWHCHKPHEPHNHTNGSDLNKGYAAGSKLALEAGVGMVDPLDFLVLPEDCSNFEVSITFPSVSFILHYTHYYSPTLSTRAKKNRHLLRHVRIQRTIIGIQWRPRANSVGLRRS